MSIIGLKVQASSALSMRECKSTPYLKAYVIFTCSFQFKSLQWFTGINNLNIAHFLLNHCSNVIFHLSKELCLYKCTLKR